MATPILTQQQERFAAELAQQTGLDRNVIRAWALAEMSGTYAQQREREGNANALNVGYFDSGAADWAKKSFRDPVQAARLTADFLRGKRWGAHPQIQAILRTAGQNPAAQLRAIYTSPWASSGYNGGRDLQSTYKLVAGQAAPNFPTTNLPAGPVAQAAPDPVGASTVAPQQDIRAGVVQNTISANAKIAGIPEMALPTMRAPMVSAPIAVDTKRARATGVSDVAPSSVGNAVVQAAKQFLGMPYSWGGGGTGGPSFGIGRGASTKGFDCSGLVQYALGKVGVKIARVTYDQVKQGTAVTRQQARPGDLIFFGTAADPHHVGLYMGNGKFIHAPSTGDVIKISDLSSRSDVLTIRRYVR